MLKLLKQYKYLVFFCNLYWR